ncbi:MAG: hypothetical protein HY706_12730 [Candidatus Hydrogenedentes bacterium]|nr:hypothetical protein [Candidatus Hydrogenedentota bacterium]
MRLGMKRLLATLTLVVGILVSACQTAPLHAARKASSDRYLRFVRDYADTMLAHGRDRCGSIQSPMFVSVLDRNTLAMPQNLPPIEGIRKGDRSYRGGNPMHDENFYLLLHDLSRVTGDTRYASEADAALGWFLTHAQSPATNLFAWGEHIYWDFESETMGGNDIHEYYRPWVLFDESYRLAPEAMARHARGLWEHQIADHEHGYFSRHATWSKHVTHRGAEFPRHAGFYIAQWAEAYRRTQDAVFLQAIETLVNYFERVRHPETGLLPSVNPEGKNDVIAWPLSQLSLSIDLWDTADKVPRRLAEALRVSARKNDESFLRVQSEGRFERNGIIAASPYQTEVHASTGGCDLWLSGYGKTSNAGAAMICYERFLQTKDTQYRSIVLQVAQRYLTSEPDAALELHPCAFGDAIYLMIAAHRLEHDPRYLEQAGHFADQSITVFWDHGPLPRASSRVQHYESITRSDTLARSLLLLWSELTKKNLDLRYLDR